MEFENFKTETPTTINILPDPVVQMVTSLIADPGVRSSIPARFHTFVEIDHEIFSMVILLLPLIQEGFLSVFSESMCTPGVVLSFFLHA